MVVVNNLYSHWVHVTKDRLVVLFSMTVIMYFARLLNKLILNECGSAGVGRCVEKHRRNCTSYLSTAVWKSSRCEILYFHLFFSIL